MPIISSARESGRVHVHTLSDAFLEKLRLAVTLIRHDRKLEAEIKIRDALVVEIPDDGQIREFVFSRYAEIIQDLEDGEDANYICMDHHDEIEKIVGEQYQGGHQDATDGSKTA